MDDGCVGFLALGIVWVVAYRVTESRPATRNVGAKLGFLSGVAVALLLFWRGNPADGADYFRILIQAGAAAAAASAASWVAIPALDLATGPFRSAALWAWGQGRDALARRRFRRDMRAALAIGERHRAEEAARRAKIPPPLPPPTREQKIARLRKEHAAAVAELDAAGLDSLELQAAKERLRQKLLKDLDGVL